MIRLAYGPEPDQYGQLWPGHRPPVVLIHGGYWRDRYDLSAIGALAADLHGRGYTVWNLEYRRLGSGGGWPATFQDVTTGLDALAGLDGLPAGTDLSRVTLVGHSAGGHLALWGSARTRLRPALVVSLAGVCDLGEAARLELSDRATQLLLGGEPEQLPEIYRQADPVRLVPLGVRQLLVHGTADQHVPLALSENYHAAAVRAGDDCTLWTLPEVDHFALVDPGSAAWAMVVDELP
ncbi:MAG: prolyl oligopeptidase family serine peptidase [Micromonosporaceae bacterium]|nr:prolyl oligopeptidase family serine peptidase [Micromonosporaceae bacterium]